MLDLTDGKWNQEGRSTDLVYKGEGTINSQWAGPGWHHWPEQGRCMDEVCRSSSAPTLPPPPHLLLLKAVMAAQVLWESQKGLWPGHGGSQGASQNR